MARALRRRAVRFGRLSSWSEVAVWLCPTLATAAVIVSFAVGVRTQTDDAPSTLRTAWGAPNLQGVWISNSATPLERPAALVDRDQLTDEEVTSLQARADRIFRDGRSAYAPGDEAFRAALDNVETFHYPATSSSIGMIDRVFDQRTSLVVDPPNGRVPALTSGGRRRRAAVAAGWERKARPEDLNSINRCMTTTVPRLGGNFGAGPYSYYQIVQTADHVALVMEAFHEVRLIPLDGRPHVHDRVRQWTGDARGRWEGNTLVVTTRNFSLQSYFRGAAEGLNLVEQFTRTADDLLTYRVRVDDPTTWATPWTAEMPLRLSAEPIFEFACHEGNRSIRGMLTTARLEEAK